MKLKQEIKEIKEYLIRLNAQLKTYPKYLRLIYALGFFIVAILCAPVFWIPIPLGLFFFLLGGKIAWDLIKDWRKERKVYKDIKRSKTMINNYRDKRRFQTG